MNKGLTRLRDEKRDKTLETRKEINSSGKGGGIVKRSDNSMDKGARRLWKNNKR